MQNETTPLRFSDRTVRGVCKEAAFLWKESRLFCVYAAFGKADSPDLFPFSPPCKNASTALFVIR